MMSKIGLMMVINCSGMLVFVSVCVLVCKTMHVRV